MVTPSVSECWQGDGVTVKDDGVSVRMTAG